MSFNLKILITGSSGYIGRSLVKYFLENTNCELSLLQGKDSEEVFSKKKVKYYFYDEKKFDVYKLLSDVKPDVVVHLAGLFVAEHNRDNLVPLVDSNLVFGVKLLDAMKEAGVKNIISTGTYWEDYNQNFSYNPVDLYAALKKSFFDILKYYVEVWDFNAITLRLYDVYGVGDNRKKIIPLLINTAQSGLELDMSPGEQFINLVNIDDVISAYVKSVELLCKKKCKNLIFDIASSESLNLKDLVILIENLSCRKINVNFGGRSYRLREVMNPKPNLKRAKDELGWFPKTSIIDGVGKILEEMK